MGIDFSKINKRYIGSLIIIPIIISLILGGMFLKIVMFTITILSLIEFSNVFM
ncbi:CDP-diglyceride synthetase, partial [Candidatus Arthromitus sp. SFB-3]